MDPTRSDSRGNVLDTVFLIPTRACSAQIKGDMNGKQVKPLRYNTVFTRNHYYHRSKNHVILYNYIETDYRLLYLYYYILR